MRTRHAAPAQRTRAYRNRPRRPGSGRPDAFSLLELVLALAILVTVAAIAAPRYANAVARYRADMAAYRLAADLEHARTCAKSASSSQAVVFQPGSDRYELTGQEDPDHRGLPYQVVLRAEPYYADLTAAAFGSSGATVTFDGFGMPDQGGQVTLQVGDETRTVLVDADTGRITVQ